MSSAEISTDSNPAEMCGRFQPNIFVLGAMKCGTSTLHGYLDRLPDVCMSNPKEPFFFEAEWDEGAEHYRQKYFAHWKGEEHIGESRHRNLYLPFVAPRIHEFNPDARLIVIARDPVDRAFSHWYHDRWHNVESLSFWDGLQADLKRIESGLTYQTAEEIVAHRQAFIANGHSGDGPYRTYLDSGYYCEQLERYAALFPRSCMKVVLFEDLINQPAETVTDIIGFLGLDESKNRYSGPVRENLSQPPEPPNWAQVLWHRSGIRALLPGALRDRLFHFAYPRLRASIKPKISSRERNWLSNHYREHNRHLADWLGRDLSHWT